ncbi:MAG: hypothetical protein GXP39_08035 [Chloroflexi bacterium]|nr:hypothetical protein [Chloroflexota bacterium]
MDMRKMQGKVPHLTTYEEQVRALAKWPDVREIKQPDQFVDAPYISGEMVKHKLNTIFGPAGWGYEITRWPELVQIGKAAFYYCELNVWFDFANGISIRRPAVGMVPIQGKIETAGINQVRMAIEGAITDAIKGAASTLGPALGLGLNDITVERAVMGNRAAREGKTDKQHIDDLYGGNGKVSEPAWVVELRKKAANGKQQPATQAQIGLVAGKLAEATEWKDEGRHTFLRVVFGKASTKELTWGEARAVLDWLIAGKDPDTNDYVIRPEAADQMAELIRAEQERMGQQELPLG